MLDIEEPKFFIMEIGVTRISALAKSFINEIQTICILFFKNNCFKEGGAGSLSKQSSTPI